MTAAQAQAMLAKIRADTMRQLNECRREGGTPEMIVAIVAMGTALIEKTMDLYSADSEGRRGVTFPLKSHSEVLT